VIQALYDKWEDELAVVTVSVDAPGTDIARFLRERKLDFPVLLDHQQVAVRLYQLRYIPATFFIDRDGVLRDIVIGAFESLEDIEKAVKEYGFKFVYAHPITWGLPFNDRKLYPLYGLCSSLGVPVSMQVGHSAEPLPRTRSSRSTSGTTPIRSAAISNAGGSPS